MSIMVCSNMGVDSRSWVVCQNLFQRAYRSGARACDRAASVAGRVLTGRSLVGSLTMLLQHNTRRRLTATCRRPTPGAITAVALGLALGAPVWGQPALAPTNADYPDAADVVEAFASLRSWTDAFAVPGMSEPAAHVPLDGAHGVCVIVRRSGRVLGTGTDASGDDLMLRRAAGRALGEVLGDPVVANLPPAIRATIGPQLTIELEVAGRPVPLLGRSFPEFAHQLEPGLDGLAIRRADDWALMFPAQMRAANTAGDVPRQVLPLAVELGLPAAAPKDLLTRPDVSLYRFRTTHLAQAAPDKRPFSTVRGDVVVARSEVTPRRIAATADAIAQHLLRSFSPLLDVAPGLMGTYRPRTDQYEPLIAPPREQALAALALARYAQSPQVDPRMARRAASAGHQILLQLQAQAGGQDNPLADIEACAAIVYAGLEHPRSKQDPAIRPLLVAAADRAIAAFTADEGFAPRDPAGGPGRPRSPNGQALVAAALSRLLQRGYGHDRLTPQLVRSALDAAWQTVPDHQQVMLLPWLGWAELDYSEVTGGPPENGARLGEIRRMLDASRIGSPSRPGVSGAPDLSGGFVLSRAQGTSPTAQTLRPAAFLATMVRVSHFTPADEAQSAMDRHLGTIRFLMQLTVRETSAWSLQNPARAIGGVRAAVWDADQPVAAQALGLLTAVETLWSLEALAQPNGNS